MCHQCKKCKVVVEVKNLTEHRLNECSKKDKFKLCQRCQEAIPLESYQEHIKNKKCNQYKKNCNRCPLCHGDIPLSKDGQSLFMNDEDQKYMNLTSKYNNRENNEVISEIQKRDSGCRMRGGNTRREGGIDYGTV